MKNSQELPGCNNNSYILENQSVEHVLFFKPALKIKEIATLFFRNEYIGLIDTGGVYHIITSRKSYYAGLSLKQATQQFKNYFDECLKEKSD